VLIVRAYLVVLNEDFLTKVATRLASQNDISVIAHRYIARLIQLKPSNKAEIIQPFVRGLIKP